MKDIGAYIKSLMQPKPHRFAQPPVGPHMPAPTGLQAQLQEEIAFREVRKAIQDNFEQFFRGARFTASASAGEAGGEIVGSSADIVDGILGDIAGLNGYDSFKQGFTWAAKPLDAVLDLAQKLAGTDSIAETVQAVGLGALTGFYAAVTPFVGCITGSIGAAKSLYGAVDDVRKSFQAFEAVPIANAGGPQQALRAVNGLLDRRADDRFTKGTIQAVEAVVNTALTASGVGAAATSGVSVATKIGVLAIIIRRRGVEYKEMKAGRLALSTPRTLSPAVFSVCPLLGCYLLTGSDTSAIVVSCFATGARPPRGWMDEVESNKRFLDPILDKAKSFITDSVWRLEGGNISSKAWVVDKRPWVERFWIAHFGATNAGYRVIHGGAKVKAKVGAAYDTVREPMMALVKRDLEELARIGAAPA
jgi:hypothetical protein